MQSYQIILYTAFGLLPSLVWLAYYLQKDLHPEPKKMIVKIFLCGALATVPALVLQILLLRFLAMAAPALPPFAFLTIRWVLVIAFVEEFCKYLVVRLAVLNNAELDEPVDIMLYMVVAALGFAAVENLLYVFSPFGGELVLKTLAAVLILRFVGATFLHTLASALVGYFMALGSLKLHHKIKFTAIALVLASLLHGAYNFSIISLVSPLNVLVPAAVILILAGFMLYDFDEIKKLKSICKI